MKPERHCSAPPSMATAGVAQALLEENKRLRAEVAYLKKLHALSEAKEWERLATNSAKLVNILGGYGYVPMLASMGACVEAAETGELR